jgi:hypothetical protein
MQKNSATTTTTQAIEIIDKCILQREGGKTQLHVSKNLRHRNITMFNLQKYALQVRWLVHSLGTCVALERREKPINCCLFFFDNPEQKGLRSCSVC